MHSSKGHCYPQAESNPPSHKTLSLHRGRKPPLGVAPDGPRPQPETHHPAAPAALGAPEMSPAKDGRVPDREDRADTPTRATPSRAASKPASRSTALADQKQCSAEPAKASPEFQGSAHLRFAQAERPTPRGALGTTSGSSKLEATAMIPTLKQQKWRSGGAPFHS